jgi:hypothetical protein
MPRRITMRPREETSAEPIVCADVNEGLIEVSPSLVKPVAAVKPPSGISGRFLSGISFERLLDHPRRRVDADDVEPIRAHVLELVGSLWAHDRDVARTRLDVLTVRGDPRLSAADDPGLGIGMLVQVRPLTGLVVDEEERASRPVWLAFEGQGASWAALLFAPSNDLLHVPPFPSVRCGIRP